MLVEPIGKFCDILTMEPIGKFCGILWNSRLQNWLTKSEIQATNAATLYAGVLSFFILDRKIDEFGHAKRNNINRQSLGRLR